MTATLLYCQTLASKPSKQQHYHASWGGNTIRIILYRARYTFITTYNHHVFGQWEETRAPRWTHTDTGRTWETQSMLRSELNWWPWNCEVAKLPTAPPCHHYLRIKNLDNSVAMIKCKQNCTIDKMSITAISTSPHCCFPSIVSRIRMSSPTIPKWSPTNLKVVSNTRHCTVHFLPQAWRDLTCQTL